MMWRRAATHPSTLSRFAPFDRYRPKALAPLAAHVDHIRLPTGTVLARQGWTAREVILILAGEVVATRDEHEVQRHGPGDQIGVAEILSGASHPTTLTADSELDLLVVYGPAYRWAAQTLQPSGT